MTTAPDLLAIRRKRRQERRCVSCGVARSARNDTKDVLIEREACYND